MRRRDGRRCLGFWLFLFSFLSFAPMKRKKRKKNERPAASWVDFNVGFSTNPESLA